jgi:hypothetical protein
MDLAPQVRGRSSFLRETSPLRALGGADGSQRTSERIGRAMYSENRADIFIKVGADPDGVHRSFLKRSAHKTAPLHGQSEITKPCDPDMAVKGSLLRRFSTIARRQVRLILAGFG